MISHETKVCPRCKATHPLTAEFFGKRSGNRSLEWRAYCRECERNRVPKNPRPPTIVNGLKLCKECNEWLPATTEFFRPYNRIKTHWLRTYCLKCDTVRHKRWVEQNKIKSHVISKRSYDKHREKRIAKEVARDKRLRSDPILGPLKRMRDNAIKARRRQNPELLEKQRAWDRRYAKTDPGSSRYKRRRARKANAQGHHTRSDVLRIADRQSWLCFWCGTDIHQSLSTDHYIPLSRGGSDWPSNIVASCRSCNSRKHDKLPSEFLSSLNKTPQSSVD